jgi:hypothetical protein
VSGTAVVLLAGLLIGHFLGDFTPLSTGRMQAAKARGRPIGPILEHALVHTLFTVAAVAIIARPGISMVAVAGGIQLVTHFQLDWAKGRLSAAQTAFGDMKRQAYWTVFGLDQLLHCMVLLVIACVVLGA